MLLMTFMKLILMRAMKKKRNKKKEVKSQKGNLYYLLILTSVEMNNRESWFTKEIQLKNLLKNFAWNIILMMRLKISLRNYWNNK
jgi:hypothetical protein